MRYGNLFFILPKSIVCFFLFVLLLGCRSNKSMVASQVVFGGSQMEKDELLLLMGTLAYDSVAATYQMDITSRKRIDGKVNLDHPADSKLVCMQLAADSTVLGVSEHENPLVQDVEFYGPSGAGHRIIILPKADFYLRIPLKSGTRSLLFRNGTQTIATIGLE